ncbi:uroporphyrinogen decarboxylase family protein [Raoultibacter massiliensis]|uniref:uroporphyrinogen decarboxylase family protein n=1 Tax=Raoultibacter massiliensis TaxID=1852371 RepID=UPI000C8544FE|nr:uroporphyrinogen decarboxylase family protein [Raoultibacter massiliensis]
MLTKRQNLLECIRGGNPDRYVNQYEALGLIMASPLSDYSHKETDHYIIDAWGCYQMQIEGQPGLFPMHDMEHRVITDITEWRDQVKIPGSVDDSAFWEPIAARAEAIDRNEQFVCSAIIPGIFERVHHLCEITEALVNFYEEPEEMHALIDEIVEWELRLAEAHIKYVKPDALFHHDDWGTQISTFMAPEMFEEFLLEPYKQVYGYYKDHGVELIVHHSDSFGETLVPYMIDMGIDIWQGTLRSSNDIPKLVDTYGGKIAFMGGIESQIIDKPDWTEDEVREEVERALSEIGRTTGFIPCLTAGLNDSGYPGVYDAVSRVIDECSRRDFA